MRRAAAASTALLAAVAGCVASVSVDSPPTDAGAHVFVVLDEGRPPRAFAEDAAASLTLALPATGRVIALSYACDLASLGLRAGELSLAEDGALGRPLPIPDDVHTASLDDGLAWRRAERPRELDSIRLSLAAPPCFELDAATEIVARSPSSVAALLTEPTGTALIARTDGSFLRVGASGLEALDVRVDGPVDGAFFDHAGELWIFGPGPRVRHGALEGTLVDGPTRPARPDCAPALQLVTSPRGHPFEVFVLACDGALTHFDGAAWTTVATGLAWDPTARLAWLDDGVVLFGEDGATTVSRFTVDGARREESIGITSPHDVVSAASPDGFGPLVGTSDGTLHTRDADGTWRALTATYGRDPRIAVAMPTRAEEPRTLFFGGVRGEFFQWVEGWGRCEASVSGAGNARLGATTDTGALAISTDDGRTILSRFAITARPPPLRCPAPR
ncbi:hypothetical protein L6R52_08995 [Myxococcota bacterium]|nr:hypothetical protein [Myxococcota bacterium]